MSRTNHGSYPHLPSTSSSRLASKAHSMNQDFVPQSIGTLALNVLFLGETNIGESSILHVIASPGELNSQHNGGRGDVPTILLDGKIFMLYTLPTNKSMSPVALRERIQNTFTDLRKNGGIHLIAYCIHAFHSIKWILETHRAIVARSTPQPRIPTVAVVSGTPDVAQQQDWWSSNEGAFVEQGFYFDDHAFIPVIAMDAQTPIDDHTPESRHVLRTLILQNCGHSGLDFQRMALYKERFMASSSRSLFTLLAGKQHPHSPTGRAIDIVLLGETGVGKSSLINLLAGAKVAEVSSDTIGCTRTADKYTFKERGRTFHLYDTPGLVDPEMGVGPFIYPIDTIQKLIVSLADEDGPDLLLFCVKTKPMAALRRNYQLFCKFICGGRVSFALAITELEEGQNADQWRRRHRATIKKCGVDCSGYIGLGRGKGYTGPDSEEQLRESIFSSFIACTDQRKSKTRSSRFSMERMASSVTSLFRARPLVPEKALVDEYGEQIARELVSRLTSSKEAFNDKFRG